MTDTSQSPQRRSAGIYILSALLGSLLFMAGLNRYFPSILAPIRLMAMAPRTVDQAIASIEPRVQAKVAHAFSGAGCRFPPARLAFVAMKAERALEVWCPGENGEWRFAAEYKVLAASGGTGPKLKEGDLQVPEGIYAIDTLNPNSRFHLSMRVNYPNGFDREMARKEGRRKLGGDIFIHGSFVSIGCLAMGDSAIEELFYMAAKAGPGGSIVIIMPWDFRKIPPAAAPSGPVWVEGLYRDIMAKVGPFSRRR
jgi:hypothetical protein